MDKLEEDLVNTDCKCRYVVVFENLLAIALITYRISQSSFLLLLMLGRQTYFYNFGYRCCDLFINKVIYKIYIILFFLTFELSPNSPFTPAFNARALCIALYAVRSFSNTLYKAVGISWLNAKEAEQCGVEHVYLSEQNSTEHFSV